MNLQHLTREDLVAMMLAPFPLKTSPPVASELKPPLAEASSAEELAIRLAAAQELILRDLKSRLARGPLMDSPQTLKDWLRLTCASLEHEVFLVVYLDATHRLITEEVMFRGSLTQTSVYPREVVKGALKHNAAAVALAHNHPSGHPEPSRADEFLTQTLKTALALIDVRVIDHIVIGAEHTVSFAERGLL